MVQAAEGGVLTVVSAPHCSRTTSPAVTVSEGGGENSSLGAARSRLYTQYLSDCEIFGNLRSDNLGLKL